MTKEARHFVIEDSKSRKHLISAEAIVVHSLAQRILTNFYLLFIASLYPAKAFSDEASALDWLTKVEIGAIH
jgi:hypothetical protein